MIVLAVPQTVGGRVKAMRLASCLTQEELAQATGDYASNLAVLEKRDDKKRPTLLNKVARQLHVSPEIFTDPNCPLPPASPIFLKHVSPWKREKFKFLGMSPTEKKKYICNPLEAK